MILGLGLVASRFIPNRIAFSAVGAGLLIWAGFAPLRRAVLGTAHTGGIFIVFTEGILMVSGALILYIFNSVSVTNGLLRLGRGRFPGRTRGAGRAILPVPPPGRTAVTLTIFALVTFTMIAIACFGATVQANLNNTIQTESGGYSFFGFSTQPIPNISERIANNSTLAREFAVAIPIVTGYIEVNVSGSSPNPYLDSLYSAPTNASPSGDFYTTNEFSFTSTWNGMSRTQVLDDLETNASVAIVDGNYAPPTASVTGGPSSPHPSLNVGGFVSLTPPGGGGVLPVRVIGIMTQTVLSGVWVNPTAAAGIGYTSEVGFLLTVRSGISTTTAAQDAKRAFFQQGLVLFDITALLESSIATIEGFIGLLEIFVGLGLGVGIAAMGILALRAVVERRREIGMLRAMGFTEARILRAFFLEYSFVTLLGLAIGTILGIWIVYDLSTSPNAAASGVSFFAVPVLTVVLIVAAAYGLSMLAIAAPSIRASRMAPAEAVRPTE